MVSYWCVAIPSLSNQYTGMHYWLSLSSCCCGGYGLGCAVCQGSLDHKTDCIKLYSTLFERVKSYHICISTVYLASTCISDLCSFGEKVVYQNSLLKPAWEGGAALHQDLPNSLESNWSHPIQYFKSWWRWSFTSPQNVLALYLRFFQIKSISFVSKTIGDHWFPLTLRFLLL